MATLDIVVEDPKNSAATIQNIFAGSKHLNVVDDASRGRLVLFSGDWSGWPGPGSTAAQLADGYPQNATVMDGVTGYGPYTRQELWYCDTSDANGSAVRWKLAQNFYHNYPYVNGQGYFGPGRPGGGVEPERGPYAPDALGCIVDKRGDYWMGPCNAYYYPTSGEAAGERIDTWSPIYRWRMPPKGSELPAPITGPLANVRLGGDGRADPATKTGWHRPPQQRMATVDTNGQLVTVGDVPTTAGELLGWVRPNNTTYDPLADKMYVVSALATSTGITPVVYDMALDPVVIAAQGGEYRWGRTVKGSELSWQKLGVRSQVYGLAGFNRGGAIGSTTYCNGSLYFPLTITLRVPKGTVDVGNVYDTADNEQSFMNKAWLIRVDLNANFAEWIPFPEVMPFWLVCWDGPLGKATYDYTVAGGAYAQTTGQYRSLVSVGNKVILGPDDEHRVTRDPWICVYDTDKMTWATWEPPANYAITDGGHDWPSSLLNFHPVPSLGEVWLMGHRDYGSGSDFPADDPFVVANGLRNSNGWMLRHPGLHCGRRIIRFKVT